MIIQLREIMLFSINIILTLKLSRKHTKKWTVLNNNIQQIVFKKYWNVGFAHHAIAMITERNWQQQEEFKVIFMPRYRGEEVKRELYYIDKYLGAAICISQQLTAQSSQIDFCSASATQHYCYPEITFYECTSTRVRSQSTNFLSS